MPVDFVLDFGPLSLKCDGDDNSQIKFGAGTSFSEGRNGMFQVNEQKTKNRKQYRRRRDDSSSYLMGKRLDNREPRNKFRSIVPLLTGKRTHTGDQSTACFTEEKNSRKKLKLFHAKSEPYEEHQNSVPTEIFLNHKESSSKESQQKHDAYGCTNTNGVFQANGSDGDTTSIALGQAPAYSNPFQSQANSRQTTNSFSLVNGIFKVDPTTGAGVKKESLSSTCEDQSSMPKDVIIARVTPDTESSHPFSFTSQDYSATTIKCQEDENKSSSMPDYAIAQGVFEANESAPSSNGVIPRKKSILSTVRESQSSAPNDINRQESSENIQRTHGTFVPNIVNCAFGPSGADLQTNKSNPFTKADSVAQKNFQRSSEPAKQTRNRLRSIVPILAGKRRHVDDQSTACFTEEKKPRKKLKLFQVKSSWTKTRTVSCEPRKEEQENSVPKEIFLNHEDSNSNKNQRKREAFTYTIANGVFPANESERDTSSVTLDGAQAHLNPFKNQANKRQAMHTFTLAHGTFE